jgi:beta-lactamase class A
VKRRAFTGGLCAALSVHTGVVAASSRITTNHLAALEAHTGGRLGVTVIDTATNRASSYRGDERFPMCSTFKALAVAAVLQRIDRGLEHRDRRIPYGRRDLLAYAPVTRANVGRGFMTVDALCAAAMVQSDNTAANLLLATLGGPAGVTRFARSIGDPVTRLDQTEPALNFNPPGDHRDTTTPATMAASLQKLALGSVLASDTRERYTAWLRGNLTGDARLRAGVPPAWKVGDKTGTGGATNRFGDSETRNDIAIFWPPQRSPLVVAVYLSGTTLAAAPADAAIASIARLVVTGLA